MINKSTTPKISELLSKNVDLKRQLRIAKELQQNKVIDLNVQKVIKVTYRVGLGTPDDPVREINSYWDENRSHLFDL
jgi:hypothetical protein|nr:MAG TPA: hypothetical protein [Caudoviricetes sp.]